MVKTKKSFDYKLSQMKLLLSLLFFVMLPSFLCAESTETFQFETIESEMKRFVEFSNSVSLSAEQAKIRAKALSLVPSPCCENRVADKCCDCETAKSILGLSNHLVARFSYDVEMVRKTVERWIAYVEKNGVSCSEKSGDSCCAKSQESTCKIVPLEEVIGACRLPTR